MAQEWFRSRSYPHLDVPVGRSFARLCEDAAFVATHPFSPLISFKKETKKYRPSDRKVENKERTIMYASHRDACIFSLYSTRLAVALESSYEKLGINSNVIAYRALGKANYHFSAEAQQFAMSTFPCVVMAYDVTKFFDTLDHRLLKGRLKRVLEAEELSPDWFAVFKNVTKYRHVEHAELLAHPVFGPRLGARKGKPIATVSEIKRALINIASNTSGIGIPQGTPISSTLANLYLIDFDVEIAAHAREVGGFYRRYSDDIIFICPEIHSDNAGRHIESTLAQELLKISSAKTEITLFDPSNPKAAQYLGFNLHPSGASIRPGSLSRQWRKMRRAVKRIESVGKFAIASGQADKIYTKKLRKRFMNLRVRNFSSYARRSASALQSEQVIRQVRRIERKFEELVKNFK